MIFHQLNVNKIGNFLIFQGEKLVRVYPLSHFQPIVSEIQAFASPLVCYADLYPHQCLQQNAISNPCNTCDMRFQDKNAKRLEEQKCLSSWDQQKKTQRMSKSNQSWSFFWVANCSARKVAFAHSCCHHHAVDPPRWSSSHLSLRKYIGIKLMSDASAREALFHCNIFILFTWHTKYISYNYTKPIARHPSF